MNRSTDAQAEQLYQRGEALYKQKQYAAALQSLLEAAKRGHPRAQSLLGIMYQDGAGVTRDDRQAAHWFSQAAAQGHRGAQHALAVMYEDGEGGLSKNLAKAMQLYEASARQGFHKAQFRLGIAYEFGDGVPRNRQQAISWLMQAAQQGDGQAHWIADWLRAPDTPQFANDAQLAAYIQGKMLAWMHRNSGGGGVPTASSSSPSSSSSGYSGCAYSSYDACNAAKNGDYWAADRLQRGTASGSEKAWYNR
jgi:TPR repeat protein